MRRWWEFWKNRPQRYCNECAHYARINDRIVVMCLADETTDWATGKISISPVPCYERNVMGYCRRFKEQNEV